MVAARLLRFLTILAVLLMPLGMWGDAGATAMGHHSPVAAPMKHCSGMADKQEKGEPARSSDCLLACAALPSPEILVKHESPVPIAAEPMPIAKLVGLAPEAATPPPRMA
jgi:hypothetical protein